MRSDDPDKFLKLPAVTLKAIEPRMGKVKFLALSSTRGTLAQSVQWYGCTKHAG